MGILEFDLPLEALQYVMIVSPWSAYEIGWLIRTIVYEAWHQPSLIN